MILDQIMATKIEEVKLLYNRQPLAEWREKAVNVGKKRGFLEALTMSARKPSLIAEVKKGSPSAGLIRENFDPVSIAKIYETTGANALSVLTDTEYFQGSNINLVRVRSAVELPILRKDFMIEPVQIYESALLGADAVLIIVRWLSEEKIIELFNVSNELGLDAIFEVHNEFEIEIASRCGAKIIGVNNRDLDDFTTRIELSQALLHRIPESIHKISESGLLTRGDIVQVTEWGAASVLIGTAFCEKPDIESAVLEIMPWEFA